MRTIERTIQYVPPDSDERGDDDPRIDEVRVDPETDEAYLVTETVDALPEWLLEEREASSVAELVAEYRDAPDLRSRVDALFALVLELNCLDEDDL